MNERAMTRKRVLIFWSYLVARAAAQFQLTLELDLRKTTLDLSTERAVHEINRTLPRIFSQNLPEGIKC